MTNYQTIAATKGLKVAILPRNRYFLRLKYWLLGYHISVHPTGIKIPLNPPLPKGEAKTIPLFRKEGLGEILGGVL